MTVQQFHDLSTKTNNPIELSQHLHVLALVWRLCVDFKVERRLHVIERIAVVPEGPPLCVDAHLAFRLDIRATDGSNVSLLLHITHVRPRSWTTGMEALSEAETSEVNG